MNYKAANASKPRGTLKIPDISLCVVPAQGSNVGLIVCSAARSNTISRLTLPSKPYVEPEIDSG